MEKQKSLFESGNELAAYAAKQINYDLMGYYPITPSTQIAEYLDEMKAEGKHDISMIAAEGEHSAAGICYGASAAGGRAFNATSANGLMYALEQLPVQSGTRFPMVMNVACRTISGPLSIKGDHSDIMYTLNTGWIIMFASSPQEVYDFNICALKLAETVQLPVIVAFDGFFTSHQKKSCMVFEDDSTVKNFVGEYIPRYHVLDFENPVSIGSYMNEPDIINNKYQLHLAMKNAVLQISDIFQNYLDISGRAYDFTESYMTEDADVLLYILGSSYHTAKEAVDKLREQGKKVGVFTTKFLRPFPSDALAKICQNAKVIISADRQDSYGANGGNMSIELKAMLQEHHISCLVITRIYGLGGLDFYIEDAINMLLLGYENNPVLFDYYGQTSGDTDFEPVKYFNPISENDASPGCTTISKDDGKITATGGNVRETTAMPKRLAPGHGACPGCGIPVNINLLLKGIEGNVVLLFQTGCGMVVNTPYPKTAFRVPYIHNLFQNGAATLSGIVEIFHRRQRQGKYPEGSITFIMVSGDGGMDIGLGSAIGSALRGEKLIIFEYDNGGYMNTGYQLSYSTPKGAKSSTSHLGSEQYGKHFFHKDTPLIMAATNIPYIATAAESNPADFIKKAAKAAYYANNYGTAYIKALSACPLNWNDNPMAERSVIAAAVDCCYFPLIEIENGKTCINYNPEKISKKIPVAQWLGMMGRTKHLTKECYKDILDDIQKETDRRWMRLKEMEKSPLL